MSDTGTCDHEHEWIDDGLLEVFPPVMTSHCVKCGLKRHINSATGKTTYLPVSHECNPSQSVSSSGQSAETDPD